ncbi:MAG: hypothetical protein ACRDRX_15290 [Pseudonocardiaceae bacterium]
MTEVVFLDSSVLFNILEVPHKCSDRASVIDEFKKLVGDGATLVFPLTAVIETGNVIAQLAGHDRRVCMERFVRLLQQALSTTAPWAVSGVPWDGNFLSALIDGGDRRRPLVEYATMGIGSGDASLLLEIEFYRARVPSATPIRLWTLDKALSAHC